MRKPAWNFRFYHRCPGMGTTRGGFYGNCRDQRGEGCRLGMVFGNGFQFICKVWLILRLKKGLKTSS
ncbi:hypothetical protein NITGR_90034 [Nitrospina gracilis 3/211]|uniref:Uncharacterized protein n=1 Tax=Nitrospina gracilis (strain 3/211) TaxID=1266370 RepID=M1Z312_NITG3|nr:hypothetical protein NITGR_90034 [Nitrospina gracilis 3/211]